MAIAANFRKYAEAMAQQLVLPFDRPVWNTSCPKTRLGREICSSITKAMKVGCLVEYPAVPAIRQWWKDAQTHARAFIKFPKEGHFELSLLKVSHEVIGGRLSSNHAGIRALYLPLFIYSS